MQGLDRFGAGGSGPLEFAAQHRVLAGDLQVVDDRPVVEPGAADQDGAATTLSKIGEHGPGLGLEP